MKNILVPTDFSIAAENAAHYAINFAKAQKSNIILCNAYKVPSESPIAAQVAWPLIEEVDLEIESDSSLNELVHKLDNEKLTVANNYCPQITFESEKGEVCQVVKEFVTRKNIDLVVMGMAGAGQLVQWALGSNSKEMIDKADFPVLYVPYVAKYKSIKTIAFSTNLSIDDLEPLQYLCKMATNLDAEIVVYHITSYELEQIERVEGRNLAYYNDVIKKLAYDNIRFENIWHSDIDEGFRWIRNNKEIDLVAMVHRQHSLLDKLLNGSYAHKLSRFTEIPLLIFQPSEKKYSYEKA
ncbi:universal stress protein [Pedobacter frigiditerrae]|uniref:universal stress protein n=1 Tax=Pedobacter frigiditerrae TaxID=2530452 RepID=UPI00292D25A2|nr:universal stress protein [Pedobacter frigiditerrae]